MRLFIEYIYEKKRIVKKYYFAVLQQSGEQKKCGRLFGKGIDREVKKINSTV